MSFIKISIGDTVNIDKYYDYLTIADPIISKGDKVTVNGRIIRGEKLGLTEIIAPFDSGTAIDNLIIRICVVEAGQRGGKPKPYLRDASGEPSARELLTDIFSRQRSQGVSRRKVCRMAGLTNKQARHANEIALGHASGQGKRANELIHRLQEYADLSGKIRKVRGYGLRVRRSGDCYMLQMEDGDEELY